MRLSAILIAVAGVTMATPALAQDWFLYENETDNFTVNLPAEPMMENTTYYLPSGKATSARIYTARGDEGVYKVTVVDYGGLTERDKANAIKEAADEIRHRPGETTLDEFGFFEGADSQYMQTSNPDGTRSYIVVAYLPERSGIPKLFIAEGITPPGNVIAGIFQNSLGWVDSFGTRIRYQRDVEGNRYRVIPDAGGAPLRNRVP
nr:MAG: hypothetical protein E4H34_02270 [Hyphomicrobiales bacterium]